MLTVLYVTAHPFDKRASHSLSVGDAFIQAYREANPAHNVTYLDLYRIDIPQLDAEVLTGWNQLKSGGSFDQLSPGSQAKVARLSELVEQFLAADKIVVANPVWNFLFPPVLKAYIDAICIPGKTVKYAPEGIIGLASDKRLLHIQSSGSVLSEGQWASFEFSHRYLEAIFNYMGITAIEFIAIEGTKASPERAASNKEQAVQQALDLAKRF
ncbi:FMN-dependent NADH-azoreductase [Cohnella rhizosphaerae]|uniref:FMN dependent NADH:quinone oxidoreductase n=1 Tax=Cohnella rhizosphaerae TaxID=1457232 RepID=A0A9X4QTG9_9BACL|nr:FMN-dependent NADH-azoreductase [Cohnella rhizosphaerae]MDG0810343.1 FMN-dependent NADH-azoreductase [Cohnella rhizosphaerae]